MAKLKSNPLAMTTQVRKDGKRIMLTLNSKQMNVLEQGKIFFKQKMQKKKGPKKPKVIKKFIE
jgi:hypothetical protein